MLISLSLTSDQQAWLDAHVARGDFTSVEDAASQLIAERIAERAVEEDDLAWAKPYVDEARAGVERGEVLTVESHEAQMDALLASMKR